MRDEHQSAHLQQLIAKLHDRTAVIGIIGLGYVGLPLTLRYAAVGFRVLGIDIDAAKVEKLNRGQSYIEHIPAAEIEAARAAGFEATTDFTRAGEPDALIICVPTPLNAYREPDLSFVLDTTDALLPFVRPGGDLLLKLHGWPKVERVLQLIDAIEARGIDPIDVSPDHWRHVHNRMTVGETPRAYGLRQHRAFLLRREIGA